MKTLQQIEPRRPISQTDVPLTISVPGSYYLTENLGAPGVIPAIITISASPVTLDLNGFTIDGAAEVGFATNGVLVNQTARETAIFNGVVRNCAQDGIVDLGAGGLQVWRVRAVSNGRDGIRGAGAALIRDCTANRNGRHGISAIASAIISGCIVVANATNGISVAARSIISDCTTLNNGDNGIQAFDTGTKIQNCTASNNTGDGIEADFNCLVVGNVCVQNGSNGDGAGLHVTGTGTRVESNQVSDNDRGIHVTGANNLILSNSASDNGTNYVISANNRYGPIINITAGGTAAVSGNSAAGVLTTTDPWANFAH